jgi:DNA ligase-1
MVFDGELISKDYVGTMNNLFRKSEGKQSDYMIFDMLTLAEFQQGISNNDYWTRKQGLINLFKQVVNCPNLICVEPFKVLKNATVEDINEATQIAMNMGFEGAMIKPLDSKYECKRSYSWQKAKVFQSDEFRIIDFEEGDGKYKGTLGKVIVDVNGVSVGVGSGFNDNQRNEIWNDKEQYLGKYIEVQYQEKIEKTNSLRFPTVKSLRLDK